MKTITILILFASVLCLQSLLTPQDKVESRKRLSHLRPKSSIFDVPPGNYVFLLDYSGSMDATFTLSTGETVSRLQYVQREFEKAALNFDSNTNFNVIIFTSGSLLWNPTLSPATPENIQDAIAFTKKYIAFGGATDIYDPLSAAWITPEVQSIYLLTDGLPTVGKLTNPEAIVIDFKARYQMKAITINTIALLMGTDPSDNKPATKTFAQNLANATNGVYRVLESDN